MPFKRTINLIPSISPLWDEEKNSIEKNDSYLGDPSSRWWKCSKNHSWKETVNRVYRAKNPCPYCDNRKAIIGETDFKTLYPKFYSMVEKNENLEIIGKDHIRSTRKVNFTCSKNHIFQKTIVQMIRTNGSCPICSGAVLSEEDNSLSAKYPTVSLDWDYEKNNKILKIESPRKVLSKSSKKVFWYCRLCSQEQYRSVANRVKSGCTVCSSDNISYSNVREGINDFKSCHSHLSNRWSEKNSIDPSKISKNFNGKILIDCLNCGKTIERRANNFVKSPDFCFYCSGRIIESGFNDLTTTHPEISAIFSTNNSIKAEELYYKDNEKTYYWRCKKNHLWKATVSSVVRGDSCKYCKKFSSKLEEEVATYCQSIFKGLVLYHDKSLIKPLELDILFPEEKIAIEINGAYFHSNNYLLESRGESARTYHSKKVELSKTSGTSLLFVWESQWRLARKEIEKALLEALVEKKFSPILQFLEEPFPDWKS